MSGWSLRRAGAADCDMLALVGAATFLETFAGILDGQAILDHCRNQHKAEAYAAYLADGAAAWLAESDQGGAPIAFALAGPPALPHSQPGDLELKRIYSLSRFHGAGLGARLMEQAVDWATTQGAARLLLGVYAQNRRALAFYAKQGFVPIGERQFQVGARLYDDVVLARTLQG